MKVKVNTVVLVSVLLAALTILIRREGYGTSDGSVQGSVQGSAQGSAQGSVQGSAQGSVQGSVQGSADAPGISPVWRVLAIIVAALAVGGIVVYATNKLQVQYK